MRTGSIAHADEVISKQAERAANKTASTGKAPVILYFYDGMEILFRPMGDLSNCILANKHFKWADNGPKIEAICAKEIGKPCDLCARAEAGERELIPRESWFIPVYMHRALRTKDQKTTLPLPTPVVVTYEENGVVKNACGVRVLELQEIGAIGAVFKYFRNFMKNAEENGKMVDRDFSIIQDGKGKGSKSFITDKKDPKPRPDITMRTPPLERVFERVLEALPPVLTASAHAEEVYNETGVNEVIPDEGEGDVDLNF